ncbi:MAG: SPOR domain-containing protein [Comamonadaceae bacterium]
MLRFFVLVLLLINGLYFAWSQGLLVGFGFAPLQQSEPQRIARQIRPDAVRLLTLQELRQLEAAARVTSKPPECLQAGLFDKAQSELLQRALASSLPAGSWVMEDAIEPARWIVYMGRYANEEAMAKKRSELASMKLKFEPLRNPSLQLGLSLGAFETKAAANAQLESLSRRGLRTAKVLQESAEMRGLLLRLPATDQAMRASLTELKPALAGKVLSPCR